jgi:hypothetical protein
VLDGLGLAQLGRHLAAGGGRRFFATHPHQGITTVFPATTAAAVTTFDSGASPTEHGILSWFLHLPDLGTVATVLRTTTRVGTPLFPEGYDLRAYYRIPSYVESATCKLGLLSGGEIPDLPFGKAGTRWHERRSYGDLPGLVQTLAAFAREPDERLAYAYWPRYDGLCHEHGCASPQVVAHFEELDLALSSLVEALRDTDTALLVLADHGLVDVPRARCIDLATVPGLMECLAVAPSGDQRQMSCFVRPSMVAEFERVFASELAHACTLVPAEALLAAGAFGPGTAHPSLRTRLGDYVLLARPGWSTIHTPPGLAPVYMPGSHGGMSEEEIRIPLYDVRA